MKKQNAFLLTGFAIVVIFVAFSYCNNVNDPPDKDSVVYPADSTKKDSVIVKDTTVKDSLPNPYEPRK